MTQQMRVLVVHNKYSSRVPSGENIAVEDEVGWLRQAGVDVHLHEVSNDDLTAGGASPAGRLSLKQARQALETSWSPTSRRRFLDIVDRFQPELVHIHNLFPLLSASLPWAATRKGLPVVWTAHNRRLICVKGGHFRDGAPCHLCRPGWRAPGIRLGCYAESRTASALVTTATSIFRGIARRRITAVAVSNHMKQWLINDAGFPEQRVHVKYHGVPRPADHSTTESAADSRVFVFAGRLAEYKGVALLLDAWRRVQHADLTLRIVGDGALADQVREAAATDPRITWVGQVPAPDVQSHLGAARAVIVPSTVEESFGRVAAEALALGRPVITTGRGGLSEIVNEGTGWITGTDPVSMAAAMDEAASDSAVTDRAAPTYDRYGQLFSPEATTRRLLDIYAGVLQGA